MKYNKYLDSQFSIIYCGLLCLFYVGSYIVISDRLYQQKNTTIYIITVLIIVIKIKYYIGTYNIFIS